MRSLAIVLGLATLLQTMVVHASTGTASKSKFRVAYIASSFYPSGKVALWGVNSKRALLMALEDANQQEWCGKGCEIELPEWLIFEANGTAPPMPGGQALNDFVRYAVASGVVAILGADWERVAGAVMRELRDINSSVPVISGGVTGAKFGSATSYPNLLRTSYSDAIGIRSLIQNMMGRDEAATQSTATTLEAVVLYSMEDYGETGLQEMKGALLWGGPRVVAEMGFESGTSAESIAGKVQKVFAPYEHVGRKPLVLISATGPDAKTAMLALAKAQVLGPPRGSWIVGATEAAESVVDDEVDLNASKGYNSYLGRQPAEGTCPIFDEFNSRFRKLYGIPPSGGFAPSSYDSMVLVAATLRMARMDSSSLLHALRDPGFGIQGLTGPLVFHPGENQPCLPSLKITQLLATSTPDQLFVETDVASVPNATASNCPKIPVATRIPRKAFNCPSLAVASSVRFTCSPSQQNANACPATVPQGSEALEILM